MDRTGDLGVAHPDPPRRVRRLSLLGKLDVCQQDQSGTRAVSEITNQLGVLNVLIWAGVFGVSVPHLAAGGNAGVAGGC